MGVPPFFVIAIPKTVAHRAPGRCDTADSLQPNCTCRSRCGSVVGWPIHRLASQRIVSDLVEFLDHLFLSSDLILFIVSYLSKIPARYIYNIIYIYILYIYMYMYVYVCIYYLSLYITVYHSIQPMDLLVGKPVCPCDLPTFLTVSVKCGE